MHDPHADTPGMDAPDPETHAPDAPLDDDIRPDDTTPFEATDMTLAAATPVFTRAPDFCISARDILLAADRLKPHIVRTPLLEHPLLNAMVGGRVLLKLETVQVGGSFKSRGAFNRLLQLSDTERQSGVVAWSSGNHALAIAMAARHVGTRATIVMPHDAPGVKVAATRGQGAEVVFYHRQTENRETIARAIVRERGAVLVPSFDDPAIIAGQGTCGLELVEQALELDAEPDAVVVCCSGGGLAAGIALAVHDRLPRCQIFTAEPDGYDDMARSLSTGQIEEADVHQPSICDALLAPRPGELTFPILHHHATGGVAVPDAAVRETMRFCHTMLKLVVEPGGAVALAAVLSGQVPAQGRTIAVTVSGANVNPEFYAKVITGRD